MPAHCSVEDCTEDSVAALEERSFCYPHFLIYVYGRLESLSQEMQEPQAPLSLPANTAANGRFLESCVRVAADVACASSTPGVREQARLLDLLLWASELHSVLNRGPASRRIA